MYPGGSKKSSVAETVGGHASAAHQGSGGDLFSRMERRRRSVLVVDDAFFLFKAFDSIFDFSQLDEQRFQFAAFGDDLRQPLRLLLQVLEFGFEGGRASLTATQLPLKLLPGRVN
jgi:hypothetical protein